MPRDPMQTIGIMMLLFAGALALMGVLLLIGGRLGLGSLPGDVHASGQNWGCYIPIATSIILSIILTLLVNLFLRWFR